MQAGWGSLGFCVQSLFGRRQHAESPLGAGRIAAEQFRVFCGPAIERLGILQAACLLEKLA